MFAQVFQARIKDRDLWERQTATWRKEIRPKTTGFVGFTSGVTDDDQMITIARFTSAEAAKVDNDVAEQGAWFEETSKAFDGEVTFHDCREVDEMFGGGSNEARFVQVMQGRAKDQEQMRRRGRDLEPEMRKLRPDVLGGLVAWHGDGGFTQVVYFKSRDEARENERGMADSPVFQEFMSLIDGDLTFYDLEQPQFE